MVGYDSGRKGMKVYELRAKLDGRQGRVGGDGWRLGVVDAV